jgi:hypothetical protein
MFDASPVRLQNDGKAGLPIAEKPRHGSPAECLRTRTGIFVAAGILADWVVSTHYRESV